MGSKTYSLVSITAFEKMDKKKLISQVIAAIVLYTVISVILEKDYSTETWLNEGKEALIFGAIFGVLMWLRERFRKTE